MTHNHSHSHSHAPPDFNRAFVLAIILNLTFVGIQVAYGIVGNSLALVAIAHLIMLEGGSDDFLHETMERLRHDF